MPHAQQNERCALTLLALADIGPRTPWQKAKQPLLRIWDIMEFMRDRYKKIYAPNSRETIRRQTIHQFEQARIVDRNPDDPARPTNSGKTVYKLTDAILSVIKLYGQSQFNQAAANFMKSFGTLKEAYDKNRDHQRIPLKKVNGENVFLSPGEHNELQIAIIEQFGQRFAPGATILYVGDTAHKHVICETQQLSRLHIRITEHDKLPDIIFYQESRNWLFLVEAVTSHGPVSPKRHMEIEHLLDKCSAERVYVTAFRDINAFRKYAGDIAWETEVWIAEFPDHMIHFNGGKFLGPYNHD